MVTEALNSASTLGPSARTLGQALHMEVDEMTPPSYSRLASGSNVVAILTGLPVKVAYTLYIQYCLVMFCFH